MAETSTTHPQVVPEHPTPPQESQRFPVLWERLAVREVHVAPILAGLRVRALGGRGIDREPHHLLGGQLGEGTAHAQRLQLVKIDLPVGQGRIDTGPLSLEKGRLRQFGQASRLWAAQQAVAQAKQGVSSLFQAVIGMLTKRLPCVKGHLELAPGVFVVPGSLLQQASFSNRELPVFTFVQTSIR